MERASGEHRVAREDGMGGVRKITRVLRSDGGGLGGRDGHYSQGGGGVQRVGRLIGRGTGRL